MKLFLSDKLGYDENKTRLLCEFILFCSQELPIEDNFEVHVVCNRKPHGITTTAVYEVNNNCCKIYGKNRALVDVMRSIAHEMTHMMQDEMGLLVGHIQDAGGFHEDQANSKAGELIKLFAKSKKDRKAIYESKKNIISYNILSEKLAKINFKSSSWFSTDDSGGELEKNFSIGDYSYEIQGDGEYVMPMPIWKGTDYSKKITSPPQEKRKDVKNVIDTTSGKKEKVKRGNHAHRGYDFGCPTGTPVVAFNNGKVDKINPQNTGGGGIWVRLKHDKGEVKNTYYMHLSKILVKMGEEVKAGQVIGLSGATGKITGPHLHFSVIKKGLMHQKQSFDKAFYDKLFSKSAIVKISEKDKLTELLSYNQVLEGRGDLSTPFSDSTIVSDVPGDGTEDGLEPGISGALTGPAIIDFDSNFENTGESGGFGERAKKLYDRFMQEFDNKNLAITVVANAWGESIEMIHNANGDGGDYAAQYPKRSMRSDMKYKSGKNIFRWTKKGNCCSFGLFQYNICHPDALGSQLLKFYGVENTSDNKAEVVKTLINYDNQVNFMIKTIKDTYKGIEKDKSKSVNYFMTRFVKEIENPSDHPRAIRSRMTKARKLMKNIKKTKQSAKNLHTSWKDLLGKYKAGNINFHRMEDNKNNYRAGLTSKYSVLSKELIEELKSEYNIQRIITLNVDNGGNKIKDLAKEAGVEQHNHFMGAGDMPDRTEFDKIKALLKKGNNLIHCTHGADRTGAMVGRYYMEDLDWDKSKAISDTRKYGGHKEKDPIKFLENGPEGMKESLKSYNQILLEGIGDLKKSSQSTKPSSGGEKKSKPESDNTQSVDVSGMASRCPIDKRNKYLSRKYSEKAASKKSSFLNKWGPMFQKMCANEPLFASVKLAQFILESGWGKKTPGGNSNNYFGIKAKGKPDGVLWKGAAVNAKTKEEYTVGTKTTITSAFRKYDSLEDGLKDHTEFLKKNKRYSLALQQKTPEEQAMHLAKAGYATGSCYGEYLIQIINMYGLKKYD